MKASSLTLILLLACMTVAPTVDASDRAPSKFGLLFAMRNAGCPQETLCSAEFNTFLVVVDGEKMRVAVKTPHFYVPRKNGFWEIGITLPKEIANAKPYSEQQSAAREAQTSEADEFVWQLWAAPLGSKPSLPKSPPDVETQQQEGISEDSDELYWLVLTWAGTDYLSVTEQLGEYTTQHVIVAIDGVARNEDETPWTPKASDTVIRRDLDSCVDETSDFNTHEFLDYAEQAWTITRDKMRWKFEWTFSQSGRAARGYEASCSTSLRPPKELVGDDSLGLGWNKVLSKVPDAQTAFASPDQSLILAFTKTQVLALRREANGLGTPFARVFLPVGDVLSAQWAIGKYADQWAEQLSQAESWTDKSHPVQQR